MSSSGMLRHVAVVRTDVSEERIASFIRKTRICELGRTLAVTSKRRALRAAQYNDADEWTQGLGPEERTEEWQTS
jgi:hypothetical protein